mgnify:CR=1 FL=1|tara:strand:- start:14206 stop:14715 length:510 start_codon:yes stop_codon:yes gene_type:complete
MTQVKEDSKPVEEKVEATKPVEKTEDQPKEEKKLTPEETLEKLRDFRKNGSISLDISYSDFKKIRNTFKNDIPWEGPNQAYLLTILMLGLEAALSTMDPKNKETQKVPLKNDSIESIAFFLNKINGKNSHSAQNSLGMFFALQQAIAQLKQVDKEIADLSPKEKTNDTK